MAQTNFTPHKQFLDTYEIFDTPIQKEILDPYKKFLNGPYSYSICDISIKNS